MKIAMLKKVLFIHNSIPEYRIEFWKKLSNLVDLTVLVTEKGLENKIYGFDNDKKELNIKYWDSSSKKEILDNINKWDLIILPPIDNIKNFLIAIKINILCRKYNIPFIYWTEKWILENNYRPLLKKFKDLMKTYMIKIAASRASMYIASGSKSKEYLHNFVGIPNSKIKIAIDSSTSNLSVSKVTQFNIHKKYNIPKSSKVVLFLGRLIYRKGCDLLINACLPILASQNMYLLICGDGKQKENLIQLAKKNPNIIFVGKVEPNIRKNFYAQSDIFVLPSRVYKGTIEAWGLTINEALEYGLPVATTKAVGAAYDLINSSNGKVIKKIDAVHLRKGIVELLNNYSFSKVKISQDYKYKYSVSNMSTQFYNVINLLTSK